MTLACLVAATVGAVPATAAESSYTGTVDNDASTADPKSKVFFYDASAAGGLDLVLDWVDPAANLNVFVKDAAGTTLAAAATTQRPEKIRVELPAAGRYKLNVVAKTGGSAYRMTVTTGGAAVAAQPRYVTSLGTSAHAEVAPSGHDVDGVGNLYAASTANDEVLKYSADGQLLWRVGKRGPRTNGTFSNPRDIAVHDGRVYVADTGYNRVQVLDALDGRWLATWSTFFKAPLGVSTGVDENGAPIVLVADSTAQRVYTFTPAGVPLRSIGSGAVGSADGVFNQVRDAATDAAGNIYTADFKNQRVQVFSPTGTFLRKWGTGCFGLCPDPQPGEFKEPYGVDVDDLGRVYVSDNRRIQRFSPEGDYQTEYGSAGEGPDQFFMLRRVAVGSGPTPAVYGADLWGYKVLRFDSTGLLTSTFGGGRPAHTGFNQPFGISSAGDELFVADTNNQRIEVWSMSGGGYLRSFGQRGYGVSNLNGQNWPRGVTYNADTGTLWVADTKNYRVVERSLSGEPTGRVFGTTGPKLQPAVLNWAYGITAVGSDVVVADTFGNKIGRWTGNSATTPSWSYTGVKAPKAVTVANGLVYVADSLNHRIVRLNATDGSLVDVLGASVLHRVEGVAVSAQGRIFVADSSHNRIVELSQTGDVVRTFGSLGAGPGKFNLPTQMLIVGDSSAERLYVTDSNNDRIQVFDL